jgi:hypothetical protein
MKNAQSFIKRIAKERDEREKLKKEKELKLKERL